MKPVPPVALPRQVTREAEQQREGLEALRRRLNAQPVPLRLVWSRPADSAASDVSTDGVWSSLRRVQLTRLAVMCETTEAADASDYATITVQAFDVDGDGIVRTLASITTEKTGLTAFRAREMELANRNWPARWSLRLAVAKTGSGIQLGRLHLFVEGDEQ